MAENKKSFVLYCDLMDNIDHLTIEEKGILFQHLLEYVNGKEPELTDRVILSAWKPIERQLNRDLEKFEETKERRSISGREGNLKRWNRELYDKYKSNELTLDQAEKIAGSRKASHPDSNGRKDSQDIANIADNVNVNVNDINNKGDLDDVVDGIFIKCSKNYNSYADNISKDLAALENLNKLHKISTDKTVLQLTIEKYLKSFLAQLNVSEEVHQTKNTFQIHFSNWLRKQKIKTVIKSEKPIRYA
ncbi:DUF6291 domain-containing protein [Polaribacter sp. 11A2H]|uniref:DUF6291 domain-containing protein n=1 Tax=Polaribacter sp. 11A2H TaxID=2687290 RepID=UPI0014094D5E|nr:DUF6291 domain-containing protein [Polaribacter sp. 11A2H]